MPATVERQVGGCARAKGISAGLNWLLRIYSVLVPVDILVKENSIGFKFHMEMYNANVLIT